MLELGSGCGLPGVVAYRCCKPSRVLLTDLEVRDHLQFNVRATKKKVQKSVKAGQQAPSITIAPLDWLNEATFPQEWIGQTDVLIGSDLVYDKTLVQPLVNACGRLSKPQTGVFYYVTANTDRAGMDDFIKAMKEFFVLESRTTPPPEFLKNPLGDEKLELFELHLSELRDVKHTMLKFRRL